MTRSIAQLQAHQKMLLLRQLQDVPTLQRALPVFEWVLSQKDLAISSASHSITERDPIPVLAAQGYVDSQTAGASAVPAESGYWFGELLGFDFLENMDFIS